MIARGYLRLVSADALMQRQYILDVLSFERESHFFFPGSWRGDPLCYRGVVEGGEYRVQFWQVGRCGLLLRMPSID